MRNDDIDDPDEDPDEEENADDEVEDEDIEYQDFIRREFGDGPIARDSKPWVRWTVMLILALAAMRLLVVLL